MTLQLTSKQLVIRGFLATQTVTRKSKNYTKMDALSDVMVKLGDIKAQLHCPFYGQIVI